MKRNVNKLEVEEALCALLEELDRIRDVEWAPLSAFSGRVLAEDVVAPFPVPHFPKSAMDGYAVRAEDVAAASPEHPVRLRVIGEVLAGDSLQALQTGQNGTAVRIMTGAAVPEGYDAVVRQEDTDYGEEEVEIYQSIPLYRNYCKVGEDIEKGSVVLPAGTKLGRVEAGVLASLGIASVPVLRKLRVKILSTGSELCEPDQGIVSGGIPAGAGENEPVAAIAENVAPPVGRIYSSIPYTLRCSLEEAGFTAEHTLCPDDPDEIATQLGYALETADVIITTGGVSVGKKDLLPEVLERIGAKKIFGGVNIQPGTPTIGSVKDGKPVLSLSGNPYAAIVNFDLYFWEIAAKLTGCSTFRPIKEDAVLQDDYPKENRLRRMVRARTVNGKVYLPAKSHASSVLSNLLDCNSYLDVPPATSLKAGDVVRIIRTD